MISIGTRVVAQGRYLGTVDWAVEMAKGDHVTWAYRVQYRHGWPKLHGWFLARDVETRSE